MTRFFTPEQTITVTALFESGRAWDTASANDTAYAWGGCDGCTVYDHNGNHHDTDTVMLSTSTGEEFACCPHCFDALSY